MKHPARRLACILAVLLGCGALADGARAEREAAAPLLLGPRQLGEGYPWTLPYAEEDERSRLEARYTAMSPGWRVTVDRFGNIQTIESTTWRDEDRKLLARGFDPAWTRIEDVPAYYKDRVAAFVRAHWKVLGLPRKPKEGVLGIGATLGYLRPPDLQLKGPDPTWIAHLETGIRIPRRFPARLSNERLKKKLGAGRYLAKVKSCPPCTPGYPCVPCGEQTLLEGATRVFALTVKPEAVLMLDESGHEVGMLLVRLLARGKATNRDFDREVRRVRRRAVAKLRRGGEMNPSQVPLEVHINAPLARDAVTGEPLPPLGWPTYTLLPRAWPPKHPHLKWRPRYQPRFAPKNE